MPKARTSRGRSPSALQIGGVGVIIVGRIISKVAGGKLDRHKEGWEKFEELVMDTTGMDEWMRVTLRMVRGIGGEAAHQPNSAEQAPS